jgi:threonine dehydratase
VPDKDHKAFERFLKELGYPHVEETHNPAYRLFLRN